MTVLAILYWFVSLFGLQWEERKYWSKVACWGKPGFFKIALDILTMGDLVVLSAWKKVYSWLRKKLVVLKPLPPISA